MLQSKFNPRTVILLLIISVAAAIRLLANFTPELTPIATFTPIGAMALFGGAYFTGKIKPFVFLQVQTAFLLPLDRKTMFLWVLSAEGNYIR